MSAPAFLNVNYTQEAEEHHPELLSLPDDLNICEKAAG